MDKLDKPLHKQTRCDLIIELRQVRAELIDARQKIRDLTGALDAMSQVDNAVSSLSHDVRQTPRPRI